MDKRRLKSICVAACLQGFIRSIAKVTVTLIPSSIPFDNPINAMKSLPDRAQLRSNVLRTWIETDAVFTSFNG